MKHLMLFFALLVVSFYCQSQFSSTFIIKPSDTCLNGNSFSFINYTTCSGGPVTYSWNFGDNSQLDTSVNPTHSYKKAGGYFVSLYANCPTGGSSTVYEYLTVYPSPVVAPIMADTILCANQATYFKDTTTGGTFTLSGPGGWVVKDTGYASPSDVGIYTISYKVINQFGCATTSSVRVVVSANETPSINIATNNNPLCTDSCATFKTSSIQYGGAKPALQWQLNGLNVGTGDSVYNYCGAKNGDKVACLLTRSYNGCLASSIANSDTVTIQTIAPPNITGDSTMYVGNIDTLHIAALGNDWRSSNTGVATVDSDGIVTAHNRGSVVISDNATYSCGNAYVTFKIKVLKSLPVTITYYELRIIDEKEVVNGWHTATELNTSHFIIQHSTDGSSFTGIGTVKAIGIGANSYAFTDNKPANGINYYRLESVDKNGAVSYSIVSSLTINDSRLTIYPNPAKDNVTIRGNHIASVQVIDNMGRVVKIVSLKDATNPILSVSSLLAGVYHLRIQTTDSNVSGVGMVKE